LSEFQEKEKPPAKQRKFPTGEFKPARLTVRFTEPFPGVCPNSRQTSPEQENRSRLWIWSRSSVWSWFFFEETEFMAATMRRRYAEPQVFPVVVLKVFCKKKNACSRPAHVRQVQHVIFRMFQLHHHVVGTDRIGTRRQSCDSEYKTDA
jgi:hypothetical protein